MQIILTGITTKVATPLNEMLTHRKFFSRNFLQVGRQLAVVNLYIRAKTDTIMLQGSCLQTQHKSDPLSPACNLGLAE